MTGNEFDLGIVADHKAEGFGIVGGSGDFGVFADHTIDDALLNADNLSAF